MNLNEFKNVKIGDILYCSFLNCDVEVLDKMEFIVKYNEYSWLNYQDLSIKEGPQNDLSNV